MNVPSTSRIGRAFQKVLRRVPLPALVLDFSRFHVLELPRVLAGPPEDDRFAVGFVGKGRLRDMARCREMKDVDEGARLLEKRLAQGSVCVAARWGDRVIGYGWAHRGTNILEDQDRYRMRPGPRGAYIYDTFIHPEFRGRGLYPRILSAMQDGMAARGVQRYFLTVDASNARSLRAHEKVGARWVETITYWRFMGFDAHCSRSASGYWFRIDPPGSSREFASRLVTAETTPNLQGSEHAT